MRTLSPFLHLSFLTSRSGLLYRKQKVWILYIRWYQVYRTISCWVQGCNQLKQFVNVVESIILHVTVKYDFHGSYWKFSKCIFSVILPQLILSSFSFTQTFEHSNQVSSLFDLFLGRFLCVIIVENAPTVSLESIILIPFESTILSNGLWCYSRWITSFSSFASLSSYARYIRTISIIKSIKCLLSFDFTCGKSHFCIWRS